MRESSADLKVALERVSDPLERARLLIESLSGCADPGEVRGRLEQAVELLEGRATVEAIHQGPSRMSEAHPPERTAVPPEDEADRWRLTLSIEGLSRLAAVLAARAELGGAERASRLALTRAAELGDSVAYGEALGQAVLALTETGQGQASKAHLAELEGLAAAADPTTHEGGSRLHLALAGALLELGELGGAERLAIDTRERLREHPDADPRGLVQATLLIAWTALHAGRLEQARAFADEVTRKAIGHGDVSTLESARLISGVVQAWTGEGVGAAEQVSAVRERIQADFGEPLLQRARIAEGMAWQAVGDWQRARTCAAEAGSSQQTGPTLRRVLPALIGAEACLRGYQAQRVSRANAAAARGLLQQGQRMADAALKAATGRSVLASRAERVVNALAAERGWLDASMAVSTLEGVLDRSYDSAGPLETARCLATLAELSARLEPSDTGQLFTEAAQLARDAGATTLQREYERLARRSGRVTPTDRDFSSERALDLLIEVSRAISTILELDPLLERIMDAIIAPIRAERGFLMLYDEPVPLADPPAQPPQMRLRVARNMDQMSISEPEYEVSRSVVAEVQQTGLPIVVTDALNDERFAQKSSVLLLSLRSILCFPLRTKGFDYGVLYVENRSMSRLFDERHAELLTPLISQASLALENAFAYGRIQELYEETLSLARARERILNHVSHELKTPIAIVSGALQLLARGRQEDPAAMRSLRRGRRNIDRLVAIQNEMQDIYEARVRTQLPADAVERVAILPILQEVVAEAQSNAPDRQIEWIVEADAELAVEVARHPLLVCLESLVRNAVENTPDGSRIEVRAQREFDDLVQLAVRDFGVGITPENQRHIFEGFFHTQETVRYSSKQPYAFDAGGKGLDLLRVQTFAERYGWDIDFESERCRFIPDDADVCPGRVADCAHCQSRQTCLENGQTEFRLSVPAVPAEPARTPPGRPEDAT